ncbi:hypothetical protein QFZ79_003562 [Arthrobacter sp. V4I6]|uniref:COG1470 family protein n=1 Tax=unclassified Arthrobacter TaxID=235627 RepID=UPI002782041D|nr:MULTISPECIES: hypothetical protein [unclassified Arthrobacter]MDQ0821188.1 hypothetical protein [Arthrobacter sp. V1I7]MDQ0855451.1 hypothetical protein [Arthrobacter sp. V4I6]
MSTTATLDSPLVSLEAGAEAVVPLHIRNDGEIVEEYKLRVVGPSGSWTEVVPGIVSLFPGQNTTASVEFRPPRSSEVPAGEFPYAVQVLPTEHPEEAVAPEGVLQLLPFHQTTAELMPRQSRGCFGAQHRVAVDNYGNVPITVTLAGSDPGDLLNISCREPTLTVGPGLVEFARVRVHPRSTIWRGMPAMHSFAVAAKPVDAPPVVLDGTHLQEPVLPRWIIKAVLILVLFVLILVALWFVLLNPPGETRSAGVARDPVASVSQSFAAPVRL